MGRKILFITSDQQRYDSLGVNGGTIARTPVLDGLAEAGINYRRAYCQHPLCLPARSTMLTSQYVRTHGACSNNQDLPLDAPSVAAYLKERAGYRTALIGKPHFVNGGIEGQISREGSNGPYRGFDWVEFAGHAALTPRGKPVMHYGFWLEKNHAEHLRSFAPLLHGKPGGDTGAPETKINPIPRELYHTDWIAERTITHLKSLDQEDDWFVWLSFPDPHHPWDPPESELHRVNWRELDLPPGHPGSAERIREILSSKPAHWLGYYEGRTKLASGPMAYVASQMTHDQIREINAMAHIMNELIDEAIGRVLECVRARGWEDDTDVIFTTDHGELQGDYGMCFKGPFMTDSLMRLPYIWYPAPSAAIPNAEVSEPVGQIDLAPTFCTIAGLEPADWMQGQPLPTASGSERKRVMCEYDSAMDRIGMHLRSIYRDGWLCTVYEPSTGPNLEESPLSDGGVSYDGTEGELYDVEADPHQWENRWDDPSLQSLKSDLIADLYDNLPEPRKEKVPIKPLAALRRD
jgi:arylsulfatase A-like enzyme